jgi:hypothetical protein
VKPAIPVRLQSLDGESRFPLYALPDSGADFSTFPEEWASPLGIDLAACEKRRVNTGAGVVHHHEWKSPLVAMIAGREIELRACFAPILVGLLGRGDFFKHFRVEVDQRAHVTFLRAYET